MTTPSFFETFFLDSPVLEALREMNYKQATPIQEQAIPHILEGNDLIALAETGSGKTAACAIPLVHKVNTTEQKIQALIIVPTRELALQYSTETQKIGKRKGVKVFALFGGEDMHMQREKLKHGVHILIATPGRLIDFIFARAIDLTHVLTLVLDEADQMLGMGFYEDLEFIMQCLVQKHQTLLFSATMPEQIRKIAREQMHEPKELVLIKKQLVPENLEHKFFYCQNSRHKAEDLIALLKQIQPSQCLIFGNSRLEVEDLLRRLKSHFSQVDFLHGGLEQSLRTIITQKFSKGRIRYLIATDIAARGLDFSGITHVFNFQLPRDQETYLHRAGRAGRSGRSGTCITLISSRELKQLKPLLQILQNKGEWINSGPK